MMMLVRQNRRRRRRRRRRTKEEERPYKVCVVVLTPSFETAVSLLGSRLAPGGLRQHAPPEGSKRFFWGGGFPQSFPGASEPRQNKGCEAPGVPFLGTPLPKNPFWNPPAPETTAVRGHAPPAAGCCNV